MVTLATLYNDFKTLISQNFYPKEDVDDLLDTKQDTLVSGTSIKTLNGNSLLGSGNISISGSGTVDSALSTTSTNPVQNKVINTALTNKVDKTDGANQMTDSNAYANLGTSANSTQKTINNAIDTEISSINNSITNNTTLYSSNATSVNNGSVVYNMTTSQFNFKRVGDLVNVKITIAPLKVKGNSANSTYTLATIPNGYKPIQENTFRNAWQNQGYGGSVSFQVTTSGEVKIVTFQAFGSNAVDVYCNIGFSYLTVDAYP